VREFDVHLPQREGAGLDPLRIRLPDNFNVPRRLQRTGLAGYEPHTLACCLAALDCAPPGGFFDIGANVGVFSWMVAAATDRAVTAFEPVPWLLDGVKTVAADNQLDIHCEAIALSSTSGVGSFYISAKSDCSNSLREGFRQTSETLQVELETLDAYVERTGRCPAVLKVDTEATEPDVISGGMETIRDHKPWIVCEVLAGRTEEALMDVVSRLNYTAYQITDEQRWHERSTIEGDHSYRFVNWLFVAGPLDDRFWSAIDLRREQIRRCTPQAGLVRVDSAANDLANFGKEATSAGWTCSASAPNRARSTGAGIELFAELPAGARYFALNGRGQPSFDRPPPASGAWSTTPGALYEVRVRLRREGAGMPLQLWVLEYGDQELLAEHKIRMGKGENRLRFTADSRSRLARLVVRVSGRGHAVLEDLATYEVQSVDEV
jgi:FkbM family methyltransferase